MNRVGGLAQLGDSLFRGYMGGRAKKQVDDGIKLKKQSDGLQAAYNLSAQNLKTLHDSGVDPNSDQYKQAKAAVDGSWQGLMDFYGKHVDGGPNDPGMSGKKKGKGKKGADGSLISRLGSGDPAEVMSATYQALQKLGPPVMYQLGDQKAAQQRRDTASLENQNEGDAAKQQHRVYELQAIPADQRTEAQQKELTELTTKPVQPMPGDEKLKAQDAIYKKVQQDPNYQPSETEMRVMGWQGKTQFIKGKNGEIIATSTGPDGSPSYEVLRPGEASTPQAKPIPAGTTGAWQKQKDDDIGYARELWLQGDKKGNKISYDEYLNQWQAAQDSFEGKYKNAGHQVPHIDIRANVDKTGKWTGAGMSQNARNNPQEIPSGVTSGGGGRGINLGKENLGLPQDAVQVQIPGHSPGWIKKDQLENFKKQYPNASVL